MSRRAVITGGGTGIGKACAMLLLSQGCDVVLVGRRQEVLDQAAGELRAAAGRREGTAGAAQVGTERADLVDPEQVDRLAAVLRQGAPVDVLVANAGGNAGADNQDAGDLVRTAASWRADFDLNVLTAVLLTKALLPHIARPGGRIVAMSSIAGLRGSGSYGAAKAALNAWVWDLSQQLAADGITVNAVAPGFVPDTEFWDDRRTPEIIASRVAPIPMNRPGTPREVAEAVGYLASEQAGWTTGQVLQVNGGTLLGHG